MEEINPNASGSGEDDDVSYGDNVVVDGEGPEGKIVTGEEANKLDSTVDEENDGIRDMGCVDGSMNLGIDEGDGGHEPQTDVSLLEEGDVLIVEDVDEMIEGNQELTGQGLKRKIDDDDAIRSLKKAKASLEEGDISHLMKGIRSKKIQFGLKYRKRTTLKRKGIVMYSDSDVEAVTDPKRKKKKRFGYLFKRGPNQFMENLMTKDDWVRLETYNWPCRLGRFEKAAAQVRLFLLCVF